MKMEEYLRRQVQGIKAQAQAMEAMCDSVLAALQEPKPEEPPARRTAYFGDDPQQENGA